MQIMPLLLVIW